MPKNRRRGIWTSEMWFGSVRASARSAGAGDIIGGGTVLVRYFSRKRAENLRKINPKVTPQEASSIARSLYDLIKQHGPLSISNAWNYAKDSGVSGLNSKTHLKLMLKWMRGRKMLKQFCNQVGSNKKFLLTTLPDDQPKVSQLKLKTEKPSPKARNQAI